MNRADLRSRFRIENPEVTSRVLTDEQINSMLIEGNINFAVQARMIVSSITISSIVDISSYDITVSEPKFVDIDEFPGGGVAYNGKRIDMVTKAQLDNENSNWRNNGSGTPKKYFRRGQYIVFDRPCASSGLDIDVDCVLLPDSFDNDTKDPFNQLSYLTPFHYGLVLYLQGRAKMKIGKDEDKSTAMVEYQSYVEWCKKTLQGGKIGKISFRSPDSYISPYNR